MSGNVISFEKLKIGKEKLLSTFQPIVSFVLSFVVYWCVKCDQTKASERSVDMCLKLLSVNNYYLSSKPENRGMYISFLDLLYVSDVVIAQFGRINLILELTYTICVSSNIVFVSLPRKFF